MNEKPREEMEIRDSLHLNDGFNYVHNLSAFCKSDFKCQCKNIHSFYARHLQCHTHTVFAIQRLMQSANFGFLTLETFN